MNRETYLIDEDGRVVHEWRSSRGVFAALLLPNGHLLRDGSENMEAPCFQAGGAAGFVEEVTWENELVWSHAMTPYTTFLTHHELEPLPNGNVLVLCWERKSKEEALAAGRRPDLLPDGEVWGNLIVELKPNGRGGADVVWRWSMWDHLVQDYDPKRNNFGVVAEHPELFDINYCPPKGKAGARDRDVISGGKHPNPSGLATYSAEGATGEKDWLHINSMSYDAVRDHIVVSVNIAGEVLIIDHSLSTDVACGHTGGRHGKGGDILFRFGNPQVARRGSRTDQVLFCQHSVNFLRGVPGEGNLLLFNNGRAPDRQWSTVDEYRLPDQSVGGYSESYSSSGSADLVWKFGSPIGRRGSFYCTHISGCQRLPNGNTLVTVGPQGILSEVTPEGEEVWRYVNPVMNTEGAVAFVRQGDYRTRGRFSLFFAHRFPRDHPALQDEQGQPRALSPGRYLEA